MTVKPNDSCHHIKSSLGLADSAWEFHTILLEHYDVYLKRGGKDFRSEKRRIATGDPESYQNLIRTIPVSGLDRFFDPIEFKVLLNGEEPELEIGESADVRNAMQLFRELGYGWMFRPGGIATVIAMKRLAAIRRIRKDFEKLTLNGFIAKYRLKDGSPHKKRQSVLFGLYTAVERVNCMECGKIILPTQKKHPFEVKAGKDKGGKEKMVTRYACTVCAPIVQQRRDELAEKERLVHA